MAQEKPKFKYQPSSNEAHKPPYRARFRMSFPRIEDQPKGAAYCDGCHAIWDNKHWSLDENRFDTLIKDPSVLAVKCPGCIRLERQEYDGEVTLQSPLIQRDPASILGLIKHTEERIRANNPIARIAALTRDGDRIHVLTISPFLAERIGKELQKAYDGDLKLTHLKRETFTRVSWVRDD